MPVHNALPWLNECLDSILAQTEQNWELLVVDDFSNDNSFSTLQVYAKKDNRIKVFSNQQKGIIPALQLAFHHSSGQLITRMDADDRMAPNKLNLLKEALLNNGKGHLITGFVQYISDEGLGDGYARYEKWLNSLTATANNYQDIYRECVIPSPCWMTFRDDLIACGAFTPDTYPEDYDLCFRFYKKQLKVVGVKNVIHFWRDHQARTSRNSETYADQSYFDLKLPYFIELDRDKEKELVIWGTGKKGKWLAQKLIQQKIPFHWVTNNSKKQGVDIYGKVVGSYELLASIGPAQIIIAVAAPDDQKEIKTYLSQLNRNEELQAFFFC